MQNNKRLLFTAVVLFFACQTGMGAHIGKSSEEKMIITRTGGHSRNSLTERFGSLSAIKKLWMAVSSACFLSLCGWWTYSRWHSGKKNKKKKDLPEPILQVSPVDRQESLMPALSPVAPASAVPLPVLEGNAQPALSPEFLRLESQENPSVLPATLVEAERVVPIDEPVAMKEALEQEGKREEFAKMNPGISTAHVPNRGRGRLPIGNLHMILPLQGLPLVGFEGMTDFLNRGIRGRSVSPRMISELRSHKKKYDG